MHSTQQYIPIEDIKDDLVILKDGSISLILKVSAVNFALLSPEEQVAIIESFAQLLNSLSFPIQIVIRSKRLDVSSYLREVDKALLSQTNPKLHILTSHYRQFIESVIKENEVLDKQFYICLNVTSLEIGVLTKGYQVKLKKGATVLMPRRDHIIRQLARVGIKAKQVGTVELLKLFYDIYNNPFSEIVSGQSLPLVYGLSKPVSDKPPVPLFPATPKPAAQVATLVMPVSSMAHPFIVEELPD